MLVATNYEQSRVGEELQQVPSFMKHLQDNYPNRTYLQNILRGLVETYPEIVCDVLVRYINQWPGIAGKLNSSAIAQIKQACFPAKSKPAPPGKLASSAEQEVAALRERLE